jgi:hypothetical protein
MEACPRNRSSCDLLRLWFIACSATLLALLPAGVVLADVAIAWGDNFFGENVPPLSSCSRRKASSIARHRTTTLDDRRQCDLERNRRRRRNRCLDFGVGELRHLYTLVIVLQGAPGIPDVRTYVTGRARKLAPGVT